MIPLKNNIPLSWNIIALISFWYLFSFSTLTFNKYIVSSLQGDPILLGKSERTVKIKYSQSYTIYCFSRIFSIDALYHCWLLSIKMAIFNQIINLTVTKWNLYRLEQIFQISILRWLFKVLALYNIVCCVVEKLRSATSFSLLII